MSNKTSTQEHIPISAVYDDVIVTKKGQFCQVVIVNSVNFGLKSEEEQSAIVAQYQGFLNSLAFPIEILVHSKRLDLTNYVKDLEARIAQEANELIRYQIQEYVDFIQKLISVANIMDKKFFIIVPHLLPATELPKGGLLTSIFGNPHLHLQVPLKKFQTIKETLTEKTNTVVSGLTSMGVTAQILSTKQLIELFYRTYSPTEAMQEKLGEDIEAIGVEKAQEEKTPQEQAIENTIQGTPAQRVAGQASDQPQIPAGPKTVKVEVK